MKISRYFIKKSIADALKAQEDLAIEEGGTDPFNRITTLTLYGVFRSF